jgi:hypothetical protein
MKKIYIALAVLATAALASCVQEKSFRDVTIGENGLVFSIQGAASTRSAESISPVEKGVKFELEADEDGQKLFLEETIQDLNSFFPETKGTPAYTENVGVLYADNLNVYGDKGSFTTDAVFASMEDDMYSRKDESLGEGWRYYHNYSGDPWPESGEVGFYLNMPADPAGLTISSRTGGKFTISYTSPADAADQEDILFGYRSMDKATHEGFLPNGAPVLLNHALTGVKFAIANYDADNKITIKSISFKGLVGTATCVVTPASEDNYKDNTTNYSSAGAVSWTIPESPDRSKTYTSGDFGAPVDFKKKSDGGGSFGSKGDYPDSFAAAGNEQNLNKADASQTFWFIPQEMDDAVKLTIVYTYGSDTERTGVIDFGKVLSGVEWKAGQLRTYKIRVDEVNVKIVDTVAATKEEGKTLTDMNGNTIWKDEAHTTPYTYTYYGGTKTGVTITNTGNTDAFIRAALIGQWLDEDGNPVFGFTDYTAGEVVLVDSWYRDQFVTKARKHGSFVGLVGYDADYEGDWVLCEDGYYYYTVKVPAGDPIPSDDPLFVSYTVDKNPAVVVAGKVHDVYFVLEIATQAVTAKKIDGTDYDWKGAWKNALGAEPVEQ